MNVTSYISKKVWDAKRFGVTPTRLKERILNRSGPRVLIISVPKSGTHLLERALCLLPPLYRKLLPTLNHENIQRYGGLREILSRLQANQVLVSHLPFTEDRSQILQSYSVSPLFIVRDPRDVAISRASYIAEKEAHNYHDLFAAQPDRRSRIELSVVGDPSTGFPSIGDMMLQFKGWLHDQKPLLIRFEDLIGASGGESEERQLETLRRIYNFLELDRPADELRTLCEKLFSKKSPTFNKGTTGRWQKHLDDELKQRFKEEAGDVLIEYGYEQDHQW